MKKMDDRMDCRSFEIFLSLIVDLGGWIRKDGKIDIQNELSHSSFVPPNLGLSRSDELIQLF